MCASSEPRWHVRKCDYCIFDSRLLPNHDGWHVFGKSQRLIRYKFGCAVIRDYEINVAIADYNAADFQEVSKKDFPLRKYIANKIPCKYNGDKACNRNGTLDITFNYADFR